MKNRISRHAGKVRYAVVGLGHIAQSAVLPAFAHAKRNSELAAVVSGDPVKRGLVGRQYRVPAYGYDAYERCLRERGIQAVYIALPNHMHREFTVRAARMGVHVLCEKPMAVTSTECRYMIHAVEKKRVKLMIAYRLHFEESNLKAILTASSRIGDPRYFDSAFSMRVRRGDIRLKKEMGGGTLYDIGIYCINAARYLFRSEPVEVLATTAGRAGGVEEMTGAILRFPGDRLAVFVCSFGASDVAYYRVAGTKGDLRSEQAYEYSVPIQHYLTIDGNTTTKNFSKRDQFAPEIMYFSDCVLHDRRPEPSGVEGLIDVRIIEALYRSAKTRRPVPLQLERDRHPSMKQEMRVPPPSRPRMVHTKSPHQ